MHRPFGFVIELCIRLLRSRPLPTRAKLIDLPLGLRMLEHIAQDFWQRQALADLRQSVQVKTVGRQTARAKVIPLPSHAQHTTGPAFAFLGVEYQVLAVDLVVTV